MACLLLLLLLLHHPLSTSSFHHPTNPNKPNTSVGSSSTSTSSTTSPFSLSGRTVFVAGVSDSSGYGWGIAKACRAAGAARVLLGVWPPVLKAFRKKLDGGKLDQQRLLPDGSLLEFDRMYPLDVAFDEDSQVPEEIKKSERYVDFEQYSVQGVVDQVKQDYGQVDCLVHCVANAPEISKSLMETSRQGYLSAVSVSTYSLVSLVSRFGPLMPPGGSVISLTYQGSQRFTNGYGGGMSSAKAALEADVRYLAVEAGQKFGVRVNAISGGPLSSRAANSIGLYGVNGKGVFIESLKEDVRNRSPLPHNKDISSSDLGNAAVFLVSDASKFITGSILFCDSGFHLVT